MKLADLLARMNQEELEQLAHDHARVEDGLSRAQLLVSIDGVLRSHRFLQDFLFNRQPPTFEILTLLLDADKHSLPTSEFREFVLRETERLSNAVEVGEVVPRNDQLRIYRRVLYQARSNDFLIDPAEASILAVLRQELEITQVEHFLVEHHSDFREFWRKDSAFIRELHALRSAGLVHEVDGQTFVPDDLVPTLRRVFGIDMATSDARRLYSHLTTVELQEALGDCQVQTGGSKEERIERLVVNMIQPRQVLKIRSIGIERLRTLCRTLGATISGSKDELLHRVVSHVAARRDISREEEIASPPPREARLLTEERFKLLFLRLRGHELTTILSELDQRRGGTKEQQVRSLWDLHRAEHTLLNFLSSSDIEDLLRRSTIRTTGSKAERINRVLDYFSKMSIEELGLKTSDEFAPS